MDADRQTARAASQTSADPASHEATPLDPHFSDDSERLAKDRHAVKDYFPRHTPRKLIDGDTIWLTRQQTTKRRRR